MVIKMHNKYLEQWFDDQSERIAEWEEKTGRKFLDKLFKWLVEAIKETLNLSWTLVGLIIATLTLTGSAQQITGLATIITLIIWLLTISFRK